MKDKLGIRIIVCFLGLFFMSLGVAVSVKSGLGVSPVSSLAYTATLIWGIDLGVGTFILSVIYVLLQVIILRKDFKAINWLQIPIGIIFGFFMTSVVKLVQRAPAPASFAVSLLTMLISTLAIAFGVFMYVSSDVVPLAADGFMLAIAQKAGKPFSTIKIYVDVASVIISSVTCLALIHSLGSIGIGTAIAAILVGLEVKMFNRLMGGFVKKLLGRSVQ